jgi:MFS family permease
MKECQKSPANPPGDPRSAPPGPPPLWWLVVAGVASPLGFNIVPALLPPIQAEFALGASRMQWMVSLYALTLGLGQLLGGPLSDALGRRGVLLAGLAIFVAGSVAAALTPTYEALLAARLVQGLGACATLVIPRATVRDCYSGPDAARALALVMLALTVTPPLAPLIGGLLATVFGWRSAFVACALVGVAVFAAALGLHRHRRRHRDPARASRYRRGSYRCDPAGRRRRVHGGDRRAGRRQFPPVRVELRRGVHLRGAAGVAAVARTKSLAPLRSGILLPRWERARVAHARHRTWHLARILASASRRGDPAAELVRGSAAR